MSIYYDLMHMIYEYREVMVPICHDCGHSMNATLDPVGGAQIDLTQHDLTPFKTCFGTFRTLLEKLQIYEKKHRFALRILGV